MSVDHYENFPVASLLVPKALRHPIEVIYRFARSADDIADEGDAPAEQRLAELASYQAELGVIAQGGTPSSPLFAPLAEVIWQYKLPISLFSDLLDAFSQDVVKTRYTDFNEVLDYCRRSANPVGRLVLHLFGRTEPVHLAQSDNICSALQLINFWQDVAIDWQKQRIYLPQADMLQFGVTQEHIASARLDEAWHALLQYEIDRTRRMMLAGAPLVHALPGRLGWEIRLTVQGGLRILERIEQAHHDVFRHRPKLGARDWFILGTRCLRM